MSAVECVRSGLFVLRGIKTLGCMPESMPSRFGLHTAAAAAAAVGCALLLMSAGALRSSAWDVCCTGSCCFWREAGLAPCMSAVVSDPCVYPSQQLLGRCCVPCSLWCLSTGLGLHLHSQTRCSKGMPRSECILPLRHVVAPHCVAAAAAATAELLLPSTYAPGLRPQGVQVQAFDHKDAICFVKHDLAAVFALVVLPFHFWVCS